MTEGDYLMTEGDYLMTEVDYLMTEGKYSSLQPPSGRTDYLSLHIVTHIDTPHSVNISF